MQHGHHPQLAYGYDFSGEKTMLSALKFHDRDLVIADGAMGTYFSQISGRETKYCEAANIDDPDLIRRIHREYIAAGAGMLRTNTFAAASHFNGDDQDYLAEIIRRGWGIAVECAGSSVFVAADLGPVYGLDSADADKAMRIVLETFIDCQAEIFLFETYADPADIIPWCRYIRQKLPQAIIIGSFALAADGYTRKGISLERLSTELENQQHIDIWGLNCSIGPNHMRQLLRRLPSRGKPLSLMPNSGYPHMEDGRLLFGSSPEYFAQSTIDLRSKRTRIIGGCCGTTPLHLAALSKLLAQPVKPLLPAAPTKHFAPETRHAPSLAARIAARDFLCLCELDPPRTSDLAPLVQAAAKLKLADIDAITVADSPLARVKVDPVTCAARLLRETGQVVLPHLCCRDRNVNSLRSALLAAHSEGIRQILAITGDAIPESDSGFVKPVFNLSSSGLLELIAQMNRDVFASEPILVAAALDPGVRNPDVELKRAVKKIQNGAEIFLTQPVYDPAYLDLVRKVRSEGARVMVGLMPLVSYGNARFMSQEVPGIRIPESIVDRFRPDQSQAAAIAEGLDIACEIAGAAREFADGFYLIAPFNRADIIVELLRRLREKSVIR